MPDLAELQLVIRSEQANKAARDLNRLDTAGKKTDRTADQLRKRFDLLVATNIRTQKTAGRLQQDLHNLVRVNQTMARATQRSARSQDQLIKKLNQTAAAEDKVTRSTTSLTGSMSGLLTVVGRLFAGFSAFLIINRSAAAIRDFEQGLVGVGKTTDILGDDLQALGEEFLDLAQKIPTPTNELLEIGRAAGQLGVRGSENILKFSETVARLGSATDLAGAEAATTLARMLNITGEAIGSVDVLGSVITRLGNEFAATESQIAGVAIRVAQSTAGYKLLASEASALGAALQSMGVAAEAGGSAVGRTFTAISKAIAQGGDRLDQFAEIAGVTADDFAELFGRSPLQTFVRFVEGLNRIVRSGIDVAGVLDELGLAGVRNLNVLRPLSANYEIFRRALETASDETSRNTALLTESTRSADTLAGAYQRVSNAADAFAVQSGDRGLLGVMRGVTDTIADTILALSDMEDRIQGSVAVAKTLAVVVELLVSFLVALVAVKAASFFLSLASAIRAATVSTAAFTAALRANPIGLIASGIAIAITALIELGDVFDDNTAKVRAYEDEVNALTVSLDAARDASIDFQRGLQLGDQAIQIRALSSKIFQLETFTKDLQRLLQGKPVFVNADASAVEEAEERVIKLKNAAGEPVEIKITAPQRIETPDVEDPERAAALDAVREEIKLRQQLAGAVSEETRRKIELVGVQEIPAEPILLKLQPVLSVEELEELRSKVLEAGEDILLPVPVDVEQQDFLRVQDILDVVLSARKRLREQKTELEIQVKTDREGEEKTKRITDEIEKARAALQEYQEQLEFGLAIADKDAKEREIAIELRKAEQILDQAEVENKDQVLRKFEEMIRARERDTKAAQDAADAREAAAQAQTTLDEQIRDLETETDALQKNEREREIFLALLAAEKVARAGNTTLTLAQITAIEREVGAQYDLRKAREAAAEAAQKETQAQEQALAAREQASQRLREMTEDLQFEITLTGKSIEQKDIEAFRREAVALAAEKQGVAVEDLSGKYAEEAEQIASLFEKLQEQRRLEETAFRLAGAFGDAFEDIALRAGSLEDALRSLLQNINREILRAFVTRPLVEGLGNIFSNIAVSLAAAQGNVFQSGRVIPMSRGAATIAGRILPFREGDVIERAEPARIVPFRRGATFDRLRKAVGSAPQLIPFTQGGTTDRTIHRIERFQQGGTVDRTRTYDRQIERFQQGGTVDRTVHRIRETNLVPFAQGGTARRVSQVIEHQRGNVVRMPTIFPMRNGDLGIMSEVEDEAIFPLASPSKRTIKAITEREGKRIETEVPITRTRSGDLAVRILQGDASEQEIRTFQSGGVPGGFNLPEPTLATFPASRPESTTRRQQSSDVSISLGDFNIAAGPQTPSLLSLPPPKAQQVLAGMVAAALRDNPQLRVQISRASRRTL